MLSTLIVPLLALQLQSKAAIPPKPLTPAPQALPTSPPPSTKVAVTVNGSPITAGTIENTLWDWDVQDVVDTLVNFAIVDGEAKRLHIAITPDELVKTENDQLNQIRQGLPAGADVWAALRQKGFTPSKVRQTIRSVLLLDKISLIDFKPSDYVDVSTIMVRPKPGGTAADTAADAKTAQTYYDQLSKGTPWATVLAESTQEANIIKNGGKIGWRAISIFPAPAQDELRKLKPGQVTHPVSTPSGYLIFRLNETGTTAQPGELVQLKQEFGQSHRQELMKKLHDAAKIVYLK